MIRIPLKNCCFWREVLKNSRIGYRNSVRRLRRVDMLHIRMENRPHGLCQTKDILSHPNHPNHDYQYLSTPLPLMIIITQIRLVSECFGPQTFISQVCNSSDPSSASTVYQQKQQIGVTTGDQSSQCHNSLSQDDVSNHHMKQNVQSYHCPIGD